MKLYQTTTEFNCGIDLHSRSMYACVTDKQGNKMLHKRIRNNDFDYFLKLVDPYRHDLTVACESTFNWYFLADRCAQADLPFALGHALYMKAIHGGKSKNDRIDSEKISHLLRSNLLPNAYVYPAEMRPVRDLIRRRIHFVHQHSALMAHLSICAHREGMTLDEKTKTSKELRKTIPDLFDDPIRQLECRADLELMESYEKVIPKLEREIKKKTRLDSSKEFNLLMSMPGLGDITALVILYEVQNISRFPTVQDFASYSRLVKCRAESDGKSYGFSGAKIGNPYLRWAFSEIAINCRRHHPHLKAWAECMIHKHGRARANTFMAHKIGRAVYFMLKNSTVFDIKEFLHTTMKKKKK